MTDLEGRHQAVTAMQTSIYASTTQYLDRDVLGEAFDAGMRVVQRANPAPIIEGRDGMVHDMETNPAHHTTRRIAELERVIGPRTVHQESISDEIRELESRVNILPPQPTPPAVPDEDAKWEQVIDEFLRTPRGGGFDDLRAACRMYANLGLVPTPRIEVTRDDVDAAWRVWQRRDTTMWEVLRDFASRKNGGA